jgi:hypothetical protein
MEKKDEKITSLIPANLLSHCLNWHNRESTKLLQMNK